MAEDVVAKPEGAVDKVEKDAAYWQAEAQKAFHDRDEAKRKAREFEGRVWKDEDRELFEQLKAEKDSSEEQRKRKEGEFDNWRADIVKKHDEAMKTEAGKREAAEAKLRQKLIGLEFAAASSLFGENGKTVLTPEIAEAYFGRYVEVQTDEAGHERVVVKDPHGHVMLDAKTGKPAAFADAIGEVIDGLPNKDRILRGSGKAGSGSAGGTNQGSRGVDLDKLTPADFHDPKVRQAVKRRQAAAGGMQFGPAWDHLEK
jgi:Family of unknown function (DUF6651)